ncbi:fumarylacetoacetate hydrolase family protein [Mangrovicella endophytica]|uniref:fumarylacetoacetate hydrolase family protein n=1 Tax=Mangrovicella endophytica TaxID=2066697 RepID=UPI000C9DC3C8|nr:fumarylacetoacetate hydrolase family protein [Mangrovicella endophytica]
MTEHDHAQTIELARSGSAALVGRVFRPDVGGPSVVRIEKERVIDITATFPTMRDLCECDAPAAAAFGCVGEDVGDIAELLTNSQPCARDPKRPHVLAPIDLQAIKAAGVTFVASMLERVIEERVRGDADAAAGVRERIVAAVGERISNLRPGSPEAERLKQALIEAGAWSQYLEVGIGPDAEIFTKAQPLSAVGTGAEVGIHPASSWNNPEPEVVLVVSSKGSVVGATLGNDVNLRDVEGRSALLLSKAKDNNGSCAIGPFVRLFDERFTIDSVRRLDVSLDVRGGDAFQLSGFSSLQQISRDPEDLVAQAINAHHAYPDGLVLFLGTMFAPTKDRGEDGKGFTHKRGDVVTISAPELGALVNRVAPTNEVEPWTFGLRDLMGNLATRGLIG